MENKEAVVDSPYSLTKLQTMFRKNVSLLAARSLAPRAEEVDRAAAYPKDLLSGLAQTGLLSLLAPRNLGGQGAGLFELALALEELAAVCPSSALLAAGQNLGAGLVSKWGSPSQQAAWLNGIMSGRLIFGHLTAPVTALDPGATPLTFKETADGPVLEGGEVFVVNGGCAGLLGLWARGEAGPAFVMIPAQDLPRRPRTLKGATGAEALAPALMEINGFAVPGSAFLGSRDPEAVAWFTAASALVHAAVAVGAARGAQEYALEYSRKRQQFGLPIGRFQAVRELLAEAALDVETARQLTLKSCASQDAGQAEAPRLALMARWGAVRGAARATADAVQVCGGYGYTKEYPIEKLMRLAQLCRALDGGDQAQAQALAAVL